ncbi:uncharacterized protein TNCV_1964631 [Trichonephila clavipes]|nr:uncharacterized protein TNCV_1964631 [Trichonephila clavipes]
MAPGSRCMNDNTFGYKMSWRYHWAVMVPRINPRGERLYLNSSCSTPLQTEASMGGPQGQPAHLLVAAIPNVLQPGTFVWFKKTHESQVKVLSVPGWRPMRQLAVHVYFLRCGGLLDDWSVEGVMSLVFV